MTRSILLSLVVFVGTAFGDGPTEFSLADLIEKVEPSCVRVDVRTPLGAAIGSGFVVQQNDWVVTNHHVVAGASQGEVCFSDDTKAKIEGFLVYDKRRDVAVLKIAAEDKRTPLVLSAAAPRKGETAIAIGAPRGLSFTATEGIISAVRAGVDLEQFGVIAEGTWLQISVPISPGSSGGPLVNKAGEVVGASTSGLQNSQNVNFAISAADIAAVLEKAATAKVQDLSRIEPLPEDIAAGVPQRPGVQSMPPQGGRMPGGNVTIHLPAQRKFAHGYKTAMETDDFDKTT